MTTQERITKTATLTQNEGGDMPQKKPATLTSQQQMEARFTRRAEWLDPETLNRLSDITPVDIERYVIPIKTDEDSGSVNIGSPELRTDLNTPVEQRYCLASLMPAITRACSYRFAQQRKEDERHDQLSRTFLQDPAGEDRLYTLFHQLGHTIYGGTGLNQGRFYGVDWLDHGMIKAYEPLSYLSLLFTPFARTADGRPICFTGQHVLVVSDEAMDATGLPAGYGVALSWRDFGQMRTLINGTSVAKGLAIGFETAAQIGLQLPEEWTTYDLVVCVSDVKINPPVPGAYNGAFGITWDNIHTIHGQPVRLGYEFWQFLWLNDALKDSLRQHVLEEPLPSWESMLLGLENARQLQAYRNGAVYQPLQLHSKVMEALTVLGPTYPWVAEQLESVVLNYLLTQPFAGTRYKLALVVHDRVQHSFRHTEDGSARLLGGKYPITAGLMQLTGDGETTDHFLVIDKSTADRFNIDSDGDAAFICEGPLFDQILEHQLVKPARDIQVQGRAKNKAPLTLEQMARIGWHVLTQGSAIGSLTLSYYLAEIANDAYEMALNLAVYYQGIEAVIKSAKWDMDLSGLLHRDREAEQLLKEVFPMPFQRRYREQLRHQINVDHLKVEELLKKRIEEPPHYMESLWNAILDRGQRECESLRNGAQELRTFADRIGPVLLPEETSTLDQEISDIKALNNLWSELRPGGQLQDNAPQLAQAVSDAGQVFSIEALRIAVRSYLQHARSQGSFPIHLAYSRLGDIFADTTVEYTLERTSEYELVRVYSPEVREATFEVAASVRMDGEIPESPETLFLPGDQCAITDFGGYQLITAFPYINRRGRFTKSLWLVLQA